MKSTYKSLLNPIDVAKRNKLYKKVQDAYKTGDFKTAEDLDAELEELEFKLDNQLEDLDDNDENHDLDDNEENSIDRDVSIQDEFAAIYDQYLKKHHRFDYASLADILRSASPYYSSKFKNPTDQELIAMAKDAWEYKNNIRNKLKNENFKSWLSLEENPLIKKIVKILKKHKEQLTKRYGEETANTIIKISLASSFIPIPGVQIATILSLLGINEVKLLLKRKLIKEKQQEIKAIRKELQRI